MLGRVRTEPSSALVVARSTLLIYEEEAAAEGTDMPFRPIDQRFLCKERGANLFDPFFFLSRMGSHDNYLCKPKYRWWRGEDRLYQILGRINEAGLNIHIFDKMFPFNRFFAGGGKKTEHGISREEDYSMSLESLFYISGLVGILFALALVVFWRERWQRRRRHSRRGGGWGGGGRFALWKRRALPTIRRPKDIAVL